MVGDPVRAVGVGDVDLNDHQIRCVVERERFHMLVHNHGAVVRRQIGGERGQAQRREERVLNRTPVRIGGLSERGQDELDVSGRERRRELLSCIAVSKVAQR